MKFQFCLILLATSVSAAGQGASPEETWLKEYFKWTQVMYNAFQLTWDKDKLIEGNISKVVVTARPLHLAGHMKFISTKVENGSILVDDLLPNTDYLLGTQVFRGEQVALYFKTNVKTGSPGESSGTTRGSASAFVISAIVFTCMALARA
ncbi:45 kDa antigen [Taenia solium]|eukprot:TsM_000406700 transcript=TsM_000406700 gene=TsM_000406700